MHTIVYFYEDTCVHVIALECMPECKKSNFYPPTGKFVASAEESSDAGNGQPFQIRPSKQRTKKKRTSCAIL